MKIFVLGLTYFNQAILSSPSILNPVIIMLKYSLIIGNILVFLGGFDSVVKYFVFVVLTFGLSSTPYNFTKSVRALAGYWRGLSCGVVMFLDDRIGSAPDFIPCYELVAFVVLICKGQVFFVKHCFPLSHDFPCITCHRWSTAKSKTGFFLSM